MQEVADYSIELQRLPHQQGHGIQKSESHNYANTIFAKFAVVSFSELWFRWLTTSAVCEFVQLYKF